MRVDLITKEYPPLIYGGAGVHVAELTRSLREQIEVQVRCFGAPRNERDTLSYQLEEASSDVTISTLQTNLAMIDDIAGSELVHTHTWYANFAGVIASKRYGIPHVMTAHSLEPLRPWKAEQLHGGYAISSYVEAEGYRSADAIIAVSNGMKADILKAYPIVDPDKVQVIYNGIDTELWQPTGDEEVLAKYDIRPELPTATFVGRITRQKGLSYLLQAAASLPEDSQLVLVAGAADTPEILAEVTNLVAELQQKPKAPRIVWIEKHLPRHEMMAIETQATAFICPSIYEPLGIVNLEAMACGTTVVGTGTGGIPEVVQDGVTGIIVPIEQMQDGTGTPLNPAKFVNDLGQAISSLLNDPASAKRLGKQGRKRAIEEFSWKNIAATTIALYQRLV